MITKLIAITGASGSGKTYLADAMRQALAEQVPSDTIGLISEDSYYRNLDHLPMAERERVNYDHPDAFEHDLLLGQLRPIKSGLTAAVPWYDYVVHTRAHHCQIIQPSPVLILEGILLLHDTRLRDHYDLSVFVDTPLDVCLSRRMQRDVQTRGRSRASASDNLRDSQANVPEFIEPTRAFADLIVSGEEEVSNLVQELTNRLALESKTYNTDNKDPTSDETLIDLLGIGILFVLGILLSVERHQISFSVPLVRTAVALGHFAASSAWQFWALSMLYPAY